MLGLVLKNNSQISINTTNSPEQVVQTLISQANNNFKIENIVYKGNKRSLGSFSCSMSYNKLITQGIILSTGDVYDAIGPNYDANKGSKSFTDSDPDLNKLANGITFDAAVLEFDFIPFYDSICFNFFFASEEYPEYVNKNVNDVFGFFLSSKETGFKKNLAVLEEDSVPISVDNINANKNSKYFIENAIWDSGNIQKWKDNKPAGELALVFQFDGLTTLLHAGSKVIPNKKYHIKLAIADVGDGLYDSAIFLEAGSFKSISATNEVSFEQLLKDQFGDKKITKVNNTIAINLNINFEADSFKISGEDSFILLDKISDLLNKNPGMHIEVNGHTDYSGTKEYNKTLSLQRAKSVATYLILKGLDQSKITYKGFGDTKPTSQNDKTLNRRVEFVYIMK